VIIHSSFAATRLRDAHRARSSDDDDDDDDDDDGGRECARGLKAKEVRRAYRSPARIPDYNYGTGMAEPDVRERCNLREIKRGGQLGVMKLQRNGDRYGTLMRKRGVIAETGSASGASAGNDVTEEDDRRVASVSRALGHRLDGSAIPERSSLSFERE
jgi:hypothetical protein